MSNLKDFFNKKFNYAIVGASNNESKYGYKIFKTLKDAGFKVFPVNPKEDEILGRKCYRRLEDIEETIDVVDFVVPPNVTLRVLEEVEEIGIDKVWFQPKSYDKNCITFCSQAGIDYMKDFCLMESALKKR